MRDEMTLLIDHVRLAQAADTDLRDGHTALQDPLAGAAPLAPSLLTAGLHEHASGLMIVAVRRATLVIAAGAAIAACARVPTGPSGMVAAGRGKPVGQCQPDDRACRLSGAPAIR